MSEPGQNLSATVSRLLSVERESEWVEFKENNSDPKLIGEYISALGNASRLVDRQDAYLVWGVSDTRQVVGTVVDLDQQRVGQEELRNFLVRQLEPQVHFDFHTVNHDGHRLVILRIEAPRERPVKFKGEAYVRIGSYKKKLKEHPETERRLWASFERENFEHGAALDHLSVEDITTLLDYPAYLSMMGAPLPENRSEIIEILEGEGFIAHDEAAGWQITNLGALMFARKLQDFPTISRKAARVIVYKDSTRVHTVKEQEGERGYAAGFSGLTRYVQDLLPENEAVKNAIRTSTTLYPDLAIRELIANSLIHQDLRQSGTGPTVEIFSDRIEFTNPGTPLVAPERFIDAPPRSPNERLARSMRQLGVCEERGSGWDRITFEIEFHQLPPPLVEVTDSHTRVVLFAPRPLGDMDKDERLRAVYQHACLQYVNREKTTNTTVRQRFGIETKNSAQASRLLKDAVEGELIVPYDSTAGPKAMRYVPFWADPQRSALT